MPVIRNIALSVTTGEVLRRGGLRAKAKVRREIRLLLLVQELLASLREACLHRVAE